MKRHLPGLAAAFVLAASAGCSGPDSAASNPFPFSVTSDSGALRIEVAAPSPVVVGTSSVEVTVTSASDGKAMDGMKIAVEPWMPAMDHGTSTPAVKPEGGGKYLVTNLYLYMPGTWDLELSFSGPMTDHADAAFQLQ